MSNFNNLVIPSCEEYADELFDKVGHASNTEGINTFFDFVQSCEVQYIYHENRQVKNNGNS